MTVARVAYHSIPYTPQRARALEAARRGVAPATADRQSSLYLEHLEFVVWTKGGIFLLEPAGAALLERWTRERTTP